MKRKLFDTTTLLALREGAVADPEVAGLTFEVRALRVGVKRVWTYRRRVQGSGSAYKKTLGIFPNMQIDDARRVALEINGMVERGVDPRKTGDAPLSVRSAHGLYIRAVKEGRVGHRISKPKPRTIQDKLAIYGRDIDPFIGDKPIFEVLEPDLVGLVSKKSIIAPVRANRLGAELMVFFGWCASLRGLEVGLQTNPALRLGQVRSAEEPRNRYLNDDEIKAFMFSLLPEDDTVRRAFLLLLLTGCRISEVVEARSDEVVGTDWIIPQNRTKNGRVHRIALAPWAASLMAASDEDWIIPSSSGQTFKKFGWYKIVDRLHRRMEACIGDNVPRWTPHDLRRTLRSNALPCGISFEVAEAMLNHKKIGLERTYDAYDPANEKANGWQIWESKLVNIALSVDVGGALGVPSFYKR